MTNPQGSFIWYELLTSDADAAQAFYEKVVGWSIAPFGEGGGMDYRILTAPDGEGAGGLMKHPEEGMPPAWLGYIGVDDVDASAEAVEAAGGKIHAPPWDIEGVGRLAFVADPQGVYFYLMRGASPEASTAFRRRGIGHCSWNELLTTDLAGALDFYGRLFDIEKGDVMPMGEMGDYQFLDHHGETIGAAMKNPSPDDHPPAWGFYFRVPDIEAAAAAVRDNGGQVIFGPMEVPGGERVLNAIDPQGAYFGLVAPAQGE